MLEKVSLMIEKAITRDILKKANFWDPLEIINLPYFKKLVTIRDVLKEEVTCFPNRSSPLAAIVVEGVTGLEAIGGSIPIVPNYIEDNIDYVSHYCNMDSSEGIYVDMTLQRCPVNIPETHGICVYEIPRNTFDKLSHFFKPYKGDTKRLDSWKDEITLDGRCGTYYPQDIINRIKEVK